MFDVAVLFLFVLCVALVWSTGRAGKRPKPLPQLELPPLKRRDAGIPKRFVVLDLETTGLHAHRHEIIEIGAIKITLDEEIHPTFQALIVPKKRVSSKITQLTSLDRKTLVRDGSPIEEILPQFLEFCENLPLVAFNAEFDRAFLEAACLSCGHPAPQVGWICALALSRRAWPGRSSYRLSALARDGGCDTDNEHRALGDCKRAMEIFLMAAVELGNSGKEAIRPFGRFPTSLQKAGS
jgi:DNA polymerase III epsilon subunit family exonuclease